MKRFLTLAFIWGLLAMPAHANEAEWQRTAQAVSDDDSKKTFEWLMTRAEQGDAGAQAEIGFAYQFGVGAVSQNDTEAFKWYRKSAEQGYAVAQSYIGYAYEYGKGVPKNHTEAFKWNRLAAGQGYAGSQFSLGFAYQFGRGVPQNYIYSYMWYNLARANDYFTSIVEKRLEKVRENLTPSQIQEAEALVVGCRASNYQNCGG